MKFAPSFLLLISLSLNACAPQIQNPIIKLQNITQNKLYFNFSNEGIVWSDGQQACVARAPEMQPLCPRLPAPTGPVAWDLEGRAWAALPRQGLITTLDGPPRSQVVGRVAAMSAQAVYREDGSALGYGGEPRAGVVGRPSAVVTGGNDNDYAVVGGQFLQVGGQTIATDVGQSYYLYRTARGAALAEAPTAAVGLNTYTLRTSGGAGSSSGSAATLWKNNAPANFPQPSAITNLRAIGTVNEALWGLSETTEGGFMPVPLTP